MDNSPQRSSPLRKTSYFEKYRKELERFSEEMRSKNHSNSFSEKSNKDSSHPSSHPSNPPSNPTHSTHTPAPPTHLKTPAKKSPVFEAQREPPAVEVRIEEVQMTREGEEQAREVDLLMGELQAAKGKLARCEQEISVRRTTLESVRREMVREAPHPRNAELQNYSEKMLAIETRMKFKKELHEDELNRLFNERNQRHSENVELSKLIETLEDELQTLAANDRREQEPTAALESQAARLHAEIHRLGQECAEVELKINNSEQLRELSVGEYRRYSEVYRRELVGREVAQAEERVRERNNEKRYLVEIERKKMLVRERRVENGVRQKALIELTRVMEFINKELMGLKKELATLTDKTGFFSK